MTAIFVNNGHGVDERRVGAPHIRPERRAQQLSQLRQVPLVVLHGSRGRHPGPRELAGLRILHRVNSLYCRMHLCRQLQGPASKVHTRWR